MKMKSAILAGAAVCCGLSLTCGAMPTVSDVRLSQDAATRRVTIDYRLPNEAAIVTVDIQTNGVSIGAARFVDVFGDVNTLVQPTTGDAVRRIWWQPDIGWAFNRVTDGSLKAVVTAWSKSSPPDYMVIDITCPDTLLFYATAEAVPGGVTNAVYKEHKMVMRAFLRQASVGAWVRRRPKSCVRPQTRRRMSSPCRRTTTWRSIRSRRDIT